MQPLLSYNTGQHPFRVSIGVHAGCKTTRVLVALIRLRWMTDVLDIIMTALWNSLYQLQSFLSFNLSIFKTSEPCLREDFMQTRSHSQVLWIISLCSLMFGPTVEHVILTAEVEFSVRSSWSKVCFTWVSILVSIRQSSTPLSSGQNEWFLGPTVSCPSKSTLRCKYNHSEHVSGHMERISVVIIKFWVTFMINKGTKSDDNQNIGLKGLACRPMQPSLRR